MTDTRIRRTPPPASTTNPFAPPESAQQTATGSGANLHGIWSLRLSLTAILLALIALTLSLLPGSLTGGAFDQINPFSAGRWILTLLCGLGVLLALRDFMRKETNKWLVSIGFVLNLPAVLLLIWL